MVFSRILSWPRAALASIAVLLLLTIIGWSIAFSRGGTINDLGSRLRGAETRGGELERTWRRSARRMATLPASGSA